MHFQLSCTNAKNYHQTNNEIFPETDISKIGVANEDEDEDEECPIYRPLIHRNALGIYLNKGGRKNLSTPCKLAAINFAQNESTSNHCYGANDEDSTKRSISAQTDISALPGHWRSDSNLSRGIFMNGVFTLPSKLTKAPGTDLCGRLLK